MQNVLQIKKFIDEREKGRLKIYEDIFSKCLRRIESSVLRDESYSLFLVPDFLVGKPTYNFQNCITYNIFRLKQSGFQVKYYYPNVLYITWSKKDFNTFLQIENDKGSLNKLTNKLQNPLLDIRIPHSNEKMITSGRGKTKSIGYSNQNKSRDITLNFKNNDKEIQYKEKLDAIKNFVPKTNVFSKFNQ